jgi:hypothetical protein
VGPKYSIVDLKKNVVRVVQKLCKSCTRNIIIEDIGPLLGFILFYFSFGIWN